jgi:hypothetical protein
MQNTLYPSTTSQRKINLFTPILASILRERTLTWVITGAAMLQAGLVMAHLPGWPCVVRLCLGIPCPGCGLSRAIAALLQGDWQSSLTYHAFAPFFVLALALIIITAFLPASPRSWLINQVETIERHTGLTAILLLGLVFYWVARLLILRAAFVTLIAG